jgi:hypothetical protein
MKVTDVEVDVEVIERLRSSCDATRIVKVKIRVDSPGLSWRDLSLSSAFSQRSINAKLAVSVKKTH